MYHCHESDPTIGMAYVFCEYEQRQQQTVNHLLQSLLKQLCQNLKILPEDIKDLYNIH